jgi:hypothetical protein
VNVDIKQSFSRRKFLSLGSLLFTAACGGGGGGDGSGGTTGGGAAHGGGPDKPLDPVLTPGGNEPPREDPPPDTEVPEDPPPPPQRNVIQRENAKTSAQGVTADWYIQDQNYASNREIEGYASATCVNRGESIQFFVNTPEPSYTISIYRVGWYGGAGGRLMASPIQRIGRVQPAPLHDPETNLVECNWTDPYTLAIPHNADDPTEWASGIYLAKLTAGISGKQSYIIFVVRDDMRGAELMFQASVTTYAAYNNWGGYSFYDIDNPLRQTALKVSFNRPYQNSQRPFNGKGAGDFLSWELLMLRFIEREGYDVTYTSNIAVHITPECLRRHRAFLSVGHDEYWTREIFNAMQQARDGGVHLGFFGANMGYWQVRLEPSSTGQPNRKVVCYKWAAPTRDPMHATNPQLTTTVWRAPLLNRPEAALIGVMYDYNSVDLDMVMSDCSTWICAETGLSNGDVLPGMLGYEVDRVDPASSPANIQILASSPYQVCFGAGCTPETRYANMAYYTAPSGAGVFATGTMQWNWGLDDFGPWGNRANTAVQQMTRNVLNRFARQVN